MAPKKAKTDFSDSDCPLKKQYMLKRPNMLEDLGEYQSDDEEGPSQEANWPQEEQDDEQS